MDGPINEICVTDPKDEMFAFRVNDGKVDLNDLKSIFPSLTNLVHVSNGVRRSLKVIDGCSLEIYPGISQYEAYLQPSSYASCGRVDTAGKRKEFADLVADFQEKKKSKTAENASKKGSSIRASSTPITPIPTAAQTPPSTTQSPKTKTKKLKIGWKHRYSATCKYEQMKSPDCQMVEIQLSKDTEYSVEKFTDLVKMSFLKNDVNKSHTNKIENCKIKIGDFSGREIGDHFTNKAGTKQCTFWESDFFEDNGGRLKVYILTTHDWDQFDEEYKEIAESISLENEGEDKKEESHAGADKKQDETDLNEFLSDPPEYVPLEERVQKELNAKKDKRTKLRDSAIKEDSCTTISQNFESKPRKSVQILLKSQTVSSSQSFEEKLAVPGDKSSQESPPEKNVQKLATTSQKASKEELQLANTERPKSTGQEDLQTSSNSKAVIEMQFVKPLPMKKLKRLRREELTLSDYEFGIPIINLEQDLTFTGKKSGHGGQATVYHGIWNKRRVEVAIKAFAKNKESYLGLREAVLLSKIRHPGIIIPMAIAEGYTEYDLVLEYFNSVCLFKCIFLPEVRVTYELNYLQKLFISKQLCEIVHFLHTEKEPVIHRDIKPGNVLVEWPEEQRVLYKIKLCDLGMSKCKNLRSELQTSNVNKSIRGTTFYNSPELIKKQIVDVKTDVWSTGLSLIELFTEKPAWPDEDGHGVRERIWKGEKPVLDLIPSFLSGIIAKCFEYDVRKRCSISEILDVIEVEYKKEYMKSRNAN